MKDWCELEEKMPDISIIVPIYNVEGFIDRCCKTLSEQSYKNIEVILVDDGSEDNSSKKCHEWCAKDKRFSYYYKKNGGLGDARNYGIEKATGTYIAFCDPDDWLDLDCYTKLSTIINDYNPDIIGFGYYKCYNGEPKNKVISYISEGIHRDLLDDIVPDFVSREKIFSADFHPVIKSVCTHLYKKQLLNNSGVRFESEREVLNEDFLFNLESILCAETYYCSHEPFYYYDTRVGSLSQMHISDIKGSLEVLPPF
jgi:glycosyltransferase involved in cell wall biosynthesis